jgi:hypothetical protein
VLAELPSIYPMAVVWQDMAYLFISNGKFALRLRMLVGICVQLLDRLGLGDRETEFDVLSGVFVARLQFQSDNGKPKKRRGILGPQFEEGWPYIYFRIIRESSEHFIQRLVHLLGSAFEESAAS